MVHSELKKEQLVLDQTINKIETNTYIISGMAGNIKKIIQRGESLPGDDIAYLKFTTDLDKLKLAKNHPYFGKFEIKSDDHDIETFYIGKQGIKDLDENIIVVDWRMPIASVFYNFSPGSSKQEYKVDIDGKSFKETVHVLKKNDIKIEKNKVLKIVQEVADLNSTLNTTISKNGEDISIKDSILRDILENSETSGYLREIIATIQREQDLAIRQSIDKNVIIQGVAGSGKSSIALHRLSFLIYNNKIDPKKLLILAPSELFINSVQDMLPDLELNGIQQLTFKQLIINSLKNTKEEISFDYSSYFDDILFKNDYSGKYTLIKFKGSKEFAKIIEQYVNRIKEQYARKFKKIIFEDEWLTVEDLSKIYNGYAYLPFKQRETKFLSHVANHFTKILEMKINSTSKERDSIVNNFLRGNGLSNEEFNKCVELINKAHDYKVKKLKDNYKSNVKYWLDSMLTLNNFKLYDELLKQLTLIPTDDSFYNEAFKYIETGKFNYFDSAPLYYMDLLLNHDGSKYTHIVIDEAQDLSFVHFAALKLITNTMTIIGDKEQSIFMEYGQCSWEVIQENFFNMKEDLILNLQTSYRSTVEIIEVANHVMNKGTQGRFESIVPFSRNGDIVAFQRVTTGEELLKEIKKTIHLWQPKYKRIAIICKDDNTAKNLTKYLKTTYKNVIHLNLNDSPKESGISIVASYNVKGMEFDAVMINNANTKNYPLDEFHSKLLYVVLTRAQQSLKVFYQDTPSDLLKEFIQEETVVPSKFDDIL